MWKKEKLKSPTRGTELVVDQALTLSGPFDEAVKRLGSGK